MQISLSSAEKLFRAVDTPRSLACSLMIKHGEWDQLASLRLDPGTYLCARAYYLDALATDYLRKHRDLPTTYDKAQKALSTFWDSEALCAKTNVRFSSMRQGVFDSPSDLRLFSFVKSVKNEMRTILRGVPEEVFPRFGPGSTYDDKGRLTTVADKMMSVPTISHGAQCFMDLWKHTAWGREYLAHSSKRGRIRVENSDRFTTAPKDSKTDRPIAIQPSINGFYQLGVGDSIRSRLRVWGLDLQFGQDVHRRVACDASSDGEMATIDLSSASDTISHEVVKALVPRSWYDLLAALRTTHTTIYGKRVFLQKFSAMGNGFTFELETALFASIVKCVLVELGLASQPGRDFHVYGDDIIVPIAANSAVLSALRFFGFVPNPKKTFSTGSFRESCGGDFFDGQPVRAHYLKDEPNEPHELIALANGIRRVFIRLNRHDKVRKGLVKVWHSILDGLPTEVRCLRGPESLGDLVVTDDRRWNVRNVPPARRPKSKTKILLENGELLDVSPSRIILLDGGSSEMLEIQVWQPVPIRIALHHWSSWTIYAGALYGVDSQGITPRGGVSGYRKAWVPLIEEPRS